jgi:hypothetical protein
MPDFHDVWNWMGALGASPLFPIALPVLLATAFASLADWVEHRLAGDQSASQPYADGDSAAARKPHVRQVTPGRSPAFHGNGSRSEGC